MMDSIGEFADIFSRETNMMRVNLNELEVKYFINGQYRRVSLREMIRLLEDIGATGLRTDMRPTIVNVPSSKMYMHLCNYFKRSEEGLKTRCLRVLGLLKSEEVKTGTTDEDGGE